MINFQVNQVNKLTKNGVQLNSLIVQADGIRIGRIDLNNDGRTWVARPSWAPYSAIFSTPKEALIELCFHYEAQTYEKPVASC